MRVLLVHPALPNPWSTKVFPPLGLAYLASTLRKLPDTEVRIHNGLLDQIYYRQDAGQTYKHLQDAVREFSPDVVGISNTFTSLAEDAANVAAKVRQVTSAPILMGGAHASVCYDEVLRDGAADIVVIGEGEVTATELVTAFAHGQDASNINGTAVMRNGEVHVNAPRELIQDLDSIPLPAWDMLPMSRYFEMNSPLLNMRRPKTIMITSRGCRGSCIYCAAHKLWGRRIWRPRSPENVLEEIELLYHQYGVREFDFEDDNMAAEPDRLARICQLLIDRKIDIRWKCPGGIGHWTLTPELLKLMRASGCYRLTLGIESASPVRRKMIGKPWDINQAHEIINAAHNMGMWVNATFIVGFPEDTRESIQETVDWFKKSNLDFGSFYIPVALPGTPLTRIYQKKGYDTSREALKRDNVPYATDFLSLEEMTGIYEGIKKTVMRRLILRFMNPINTLKKLRSWEDVRYLLGLVKFAAGFMFLRKSVQEMRLKDTQVLS